MCEPAANDPWAPAPAQAVTQLLVAVRNDEKGARDRLLEIVFGELHRLARRQLDREHGVVTLQPTALVNEAYLRLFGGVDSPPGTPMPSGPSFENRRHFFGAAAQAMHRICVDYARRNRAVKRGCGIAAAEMTNEPEIFDKDPIEILALDEALTKLDRHDPALVEVVRLRYFVELSLDDTAKVLGISRRTAANRWRLARAWLFDALNDCDAVAAAE